ncbi:MAG: preprotein translocase subunit YajC [Clostridiales bacterium]|nr:preprotein translocase subunit YajC [Clostridiales bacterium]
MNNLSILAEGVSGSNMIITIVLYIVVFGGILYFLMYRPQKKQQEKQQAMRTSLMESIEVGDPVLTSSGFYGIVIDVQEDMVIVEFGNNKNCRIPMKKEAVVEVEKANDSE